MNPGTIIRLRNFEHHFENGNRVGYSAVSLGKGVCFVAVVLGTDRPESPLNVVEAMEQIGWELKDKELAAKVKRGGRSLLCEEFPELGKREFKVGAEEPTS